MSLQKNTAGQHVSFVLVDASTGGALTGASVTTKVSKDGVQSSGVGVITELGTGEYDYAPTQGETNGRVIGFLFTASGAIPVHFTCFTVGQDPTQAQLVANISQINGAALTGDGTSGNPWGPA